MRRTRWCMVISIYLFLFGIVGLGEAAELISPPEGAVYEAGQSYLVRVEPGPGETLIGMMVELEPEEGVMPDLHGILEYTVKIPVDVKLGLEELSVGGALVDRNGKQQEFEFSRTITVILPPTTTVTGIGADFTGTKKTFLQIARKPSGELVASGIYSDDELSIGATYSDGVARFITDNPDFTYKSLDEKVAIVIPPGQWKDSSGKVKTNYALVKATGPGTTDIIVQYGNFTDRVTVHVKECPYTEGMRRCPR